MKYNKLIKICEEHNLRESDVIDCVKKYIKIGTRTQFLLDRFDLYAKERIKQKQKDFHLVWGSKIEAARQVVKSDTYEIIYKKYAINNKSNCVFLLNKLIADNRQDERLLQSFKNNGEKEIIWTVITT